MTGRALRVAGRRFRGKGMGGSLGFPTVNLASDAPVLCLLPRGVYQVEVAGVRGIANYGVAPTMGDRAWESPVIEIHFPDGAPMQPEGDGESLQVSFVRFVRPERRFASLADLKAQIAADCAAVRAAPEAGR